MKILGIDPGTTLIGYGFIESGKNLNVLSCGTITTPANHDHSQRLGMIFSSMTELIEKTKPDAFAIEKLFFVRNVTTAMTVGEARGVILLAAHLAGLPIYEYTPLQVKQALTGHGKAEKSQIQYMVQQLLKLKEIPKPDDMADALAIAITCAHYGGLNEKLTTKKQ